MQIDGLGCGHALLLSALGQAALPPPELSVAEWADRHRHVSPESGARDAGPWRTDLLPYARRPMDVAGVNHPAGSVWLRWSAKVGKTQVALNAVFHAIDTEPRPVFTVCPSLGEAQRYEREVWSPNVDASPRVAARVAKKTARSGEGSTTRFKRFRGGFNRIVSASSEKELQASDIGLLVYEEPSSFPADTGGRGDPIKQARARTFAWGDDAKEIGGGTPGSLGDCRVSTEVERRTRECYYVPCPHCGGYQQLLWENFGRSKSRPHFTCPECGALIDETDRRGMLAAGQWIACFESEDAENPAPPLAFPAERLEHWLERRGPDGTHLEGRDPSFDGIWQAHAGSGSWARIWKEYDDADENPEKLATFTQQVLGRPFEPAYARPLAEPLFEARVAAAGIAQHEARRIPPWAWVLVGFADVQSYGLRWGAWAIGPGPDGKGRRYARVDGGTIAIRPDSAAAWDELTLILRREYEGPLCQPIGFDRFGVDTGGHHTTQSYSWCARHSHLSGVYALKGSSDRSAPPIAAGRRVKGRVGHSNRVSLQLFLTGVHKLKKDAYFGLDRTLSAVEAGVPLAGMVTLPADATLAEFKELTAEVLLPPDPAKKRREETWEKSPPQAPNEELDILVGAIALGHSIVPELANDAAQWEAWKAKRWRDPAEALLLPLERAALKAALAPVEAAAPVAAQPFGQAPPDLGAAKLGGISAIERMLRGGR